MTLDEMIAPRLAYGKALEEIGAAEAARFVSHNEALFLAEGVEREYTEFLQGEAQKRGQANLDALQEEKDERERIQKEQIRTAGATADALIALSDTFFAVKTRGLEEGSKAEKRAALRSFQINKGLNLAKATIDGISAVLEAAPNIPLQIAVGAMALASVGAIGAAPAPKFHTGGIAPDERAVTLSNEAVLNPAATAALGESGVNALNDGGGRGGGMVVQMVYKQRVLDTMLVDNLGRPTSPLRSGINRGKATGHRTR